MLPIDEEEEYNNRQERKTSLGLVISIIVHTFAFTLGGLHYWWVWGQKWFIPCDECTIPKQEFYSYSLIVSSLTFFAACIVNLVYEKQRRKSLITSILAIVGFCFGIYYCVFWYIGKTGKDI